MYNYKLNSVVKISMMSAKYFEYYTIIPRGAVFFVDTHWASAKLCGVEQTAPPIFGRRPLGIGAYSRFSFVFTGRPICLFFQTSFRWSKTLNFPYPHLAVLATVAN